MSDKLTKNGNRPTAVAGPVPETQEATVAPRVDILETEGELLLFADLPGVKPEDLDLRFENGELTLHARRAPHLADKTRSYIEYEPANFHRGFRVAEHIDAEKISAELKHGVLTVHLPKVEAVRPRRIAIKSE